MRFQEKAVFNADTHEKGKGMPEGGSYEAWAELTAAGAWLTAKNEGFTQ